MHGWTAHIRSYGIETPQERHDFVQLVLPLIGEIELDIAGKESKVGDRLAAAVPSQTLHTQRAKNQQRALILDVETKLANDSGFDHLQEQCYFEQTLPAQQMTRLLARVVSSRQKISASTPYAISVCSAGKTSIEQALLALEELVELSPLTSFSVLEMAHACGLEQSQFHDVFRGHFGVSPHKWLIKRKLDAIKSTLENTDIALSELAQMSGYSDQTALTRAFRNHFGVPLSEYRQLKRD